MPTVKGKTFPYTSKGKKAAARHMRKKKNGEPVPDKPAGFVENKGSQDDLNAYLRRKKR